MLAGDMFHITRSFTISYSYFLKIILNFRYISIKNKDSNQKNKLNDLNHPSSNNVNKLRDILEKQGKAKNLMSCDVLCIVLAEI